MPCSSGCTQLVLCRRGRLTSAQRDSETGRATLWRASEQASQEPSCLLLRGTLGSQSLRIGLSYGERHRLEQGALSWPLGGQLWRPVHARPRARPGWAEAQRGGTGGQGPAVWGGHLALSLDTMSWTAAPPLGWLTGNSGWQRVWAASRLGGRAAWSQQRPFSCTMSCPTLSKEGTSLSGRQAGGLAPPCGHLYSISLPHALSFPIPPPTDIN